MEWPWCRSHDAPMIAEKDQFVCYWEGRPTIDNSPGCVATKIIFTHTSLPFDLSLYYRVPDGA